MGRNLYYTFSFIVGLFSYVIPKKKNYLVFYPLHERNKFSDNIKALILCCQKDYPEFKACLLSFHKNVKQEAERSNLKVASNIVSRIWNLLRAEHIILDAYNDQFQFGNYSFIQLWHGIGFKYVGLLREDLNEKDPNRRRRYQNIYKKCRFIVTSSQSNSERQRLAFGIGRTVITGYPRNDVFFEGSPSAQELIKKYDLSKFDKIITYAPTYRDASTKSPFSQDFWVKLQIYLEQNNILFAIKKHPLDRLFTSPQQHVNIRDVSELIDNTQELLMISDVLISDYSSIITDYAITGKPIILYAYDFKEYINNCRTLFYDLEKTLPRPLVKTEEELLAKIMDESWQSDPEIIKSYKNFQQKFHKYLDGNSSRRVMEEIKKLY